MRLRFNQLTSFFLTVTFVLSTVSATLAKPDEGMYAPEQISKLPLAKRGLKIKPSDIYNPNGNSLSEAVVQLSIGCTAEFVSPKGLILTNHHCGFDALVSASTAGKDYGKDGYRAASITDELPAKDYKVFITRRVEDVTAKITRGTENLSGDALAAAIKQNSDNLQKQEQAKAGADTKINIQGLNSGYLYYLYEKMEIKDVRLVYAPPQMIGFYGGDPDNFEWSRHTGDFTYLRAYVAPDGKSAEYSPNNVPYTPKKYLTMNLSGVKENDFVFVLGYPGSTTRYRESQNVEYSEDVNYPLLRDFLRAWSAALTKIGEEDEAKRVKLQGEIFSLDNSRKVYEGNVDALRRSGFLANRRDQEAKFTAWVNANTARQAKYSQVLPQLQTLSNEFYANSARDSIIRRIPNPGFTPLFKQIYDAFTAVRGKQKLTAEKRAEIEEAYKSPEPTLDRELLKFFLKAMSELPDNQKIPVVENLFTRFQGKERREAEESFAERLVENKDFDSAEEVIKLYDKDYDDLQKKYPDVAGFTGFLADERGKYTARAGKYGGDIDRLRLLYIQGMAEMNNTLVYPDANLTLRFTFGNVKGYSPREAVQYTPFTTLKGVLEKDTGVFPFDAPEKLRTLQNSKDFGRYGVGDSVPVNFLASTDIIGGNSGSPIMNGYGEQVGIVFDGNYEGLGNDLFYAPDYNRTIAVDIRYVLFVTEKFADAKWIVDEMTLKGGNMAKSAKR
ncbi:MAG: S46 family peptidase [Pyrinomonadaceae bacterium]